ncbi:MAG TPA: Ser-Thr-rich GPI-anchored membrane family protein [bacterium]|nr:Ser-Thr-rich GPI-anchored membrane family protein [bacterium]HPN44723.1 Ser-Thr-rich GPI-anchored membrane family protein [bacterium]
MNKIVFMLLMMLVIMTSFLQARSVEKLFLETNATRMNGTTTIDVTDANRYRMAPVKFDMLQKADGTPALNIGDQFILNLFTDVTDTVIIDKVFNYLPGTYTLRGCVPGKGMTRLFLTFTGEKLIALYSVPEQGRDYHIIYDIANNRCCIKQMRTDAGTVMDDAPALLPPDVKPDDSNYDALIKNNKDTTNVFQTDADAYTTVDVMIVYTPAAKTWASSSDNGINNTISQAMALGQTALNNSEINIILNLVLAQEVSYTESGSSTKDLYRITYSANYDPWNQEGTPHYMDEVHGWRDAYKADLVAILTNCTDTGGVGWLLNWTIGRPEFGFCLARVQQTSWTYTLIHEWGHNMGAHHRKDQAVQPGPGLYTYSAGWRWIGQNGSRYCSVMSYQDSWDGNYVSQVGYFSNPLIQHQATPTGNIVDGDNVRGLNQISNVIGAYRDRGSSTNPIISGFLKTIGGTAFNNIQIVFSNGAGSTTSDINGYYAKIVPNNWSGTATPVNAYPLFNPVFLSYKNVTSDQSNKNYTGYKKGSNNNFWVLSPQGGEKWKQGEQHIITWAARPDDENVYVDLYNKDGFVQRLKANGTRNDGNFTWDIGQNIPPDSTYKIRITGITTKTYHENYYVFTIRKQIIPDPPALLSPANNAVDITTTPRLEWSYETNASYRVQIAGDAAFNNMLAEDSIVLTSHYNVPAWLLPVNSTCYWRAQTSLDGESSDWSENFKFQTTAVADTLKLFIENLEPAKYQAVYIDEWEKYYTDRNYQVMAIPDSLKHLLWIRTANDDKNNAAANMISFQLLKGATIYIAYDSRATAPPDWLNNDFTLTNSIINVNDKFEYFTLWKKHAPAGPIALGGNMAHGAAGAKTNFVVLLKPDEIPAQIVVSSPNGGETWYKGATQVISWSCTGNVGNNVKIELYQAGSSSNIICDTTANNNFYTWTIPDSLAPGNDYKVRITSVANNTVWDEGNAPFTIADKPAIIVTAPNGGETWLKKSLQVISWSSVGEVGEQVKIDLYKDGSLLTTVHEATTNDDSLVWIVPDTLVAGDDYRIRITALDDNAVWDESDALFTITDIPQLSLTSPNGGEYWLKGSPQTITWNSLGNVSANLKIDLYKNGNFDRLINMNAANTGSLNWTVPANVSSGKYYQVKITSIADKTLWDASDSLFTITDHPKLTITSPNGGETWYKNSMQTITWQNTGLVGDEVKIELYKNGTLTTTISETTVNDDSLLWTIPPALASGDDYKIHITSTSNDTVWDESDSQFSIIERPSITLIEPTGGETLIKGTMQIIAWNKTGDIGSLVKIELFKSGTLNSMIRAATANDDSLAWDVPFTLPSAADYTIKITSLVNPDWHDSSDRTFAIRNPQPVAVNLLTPADAVIITNPIPQFSWTSSEFATSYRLQVAGDPLFTMPAIDVETDSCSFTPAAELTSGVWRWRVQAGNETGTSQWSAVFTFHLESSGILDYDSQAIPEHYFLAQNYPNPFNPVTTIKCGLPQAGYVEVKVFNLAGQLLDVLLERQLPPGTATLTFNASHYPSGIYYYVMSAGEFRDVKKMLLVK